MISKNLARRHLNESQRAMVAANLANMRQGDNQHTEDAQICATSNKAAAQLLNVGKRSVQHARQVIEKAPRKLRQAVERGQRCR